MKSKFTFKLTLLVLYVLLSIGTFIQTALPALNTTLVSEFSDMTTGNIGYISGTITITMALGGVLMGYYGDKIKRMRIAFVGSIITTIFTLLSGFIQNYVQLFLCQIGASIGLGATLPIMASIMADLYHPDQRGKAFSVLSIVVTVLGELGGTLIALILVSYGKWRWTYYILGIVSAIFTPILLITKEPKRGAKEEALEQVFDEDPTLSYQYKIKKEDIKYLWKRKTNLYLILNFVDNIPGAVIATYALAWFQDHHNASEDVAFTGLIIVVIGIFIGTSIFGAYGDRRFKKDKKIKVKLGTFLSMASAPFILIGVNLNWELNPGEGIFDNNIAIITVIMLAMGLLLDGGIYPNWLSSITDVNVPEHRSTMISLANFFDACGRSLGAFIGGFLIDNLGYTQAMTFTSLFTILSFVWWVPSLKTFLEDYNEVQNILEERANSLKNQLSEIRTK